MTAAVRTTATVHRLPHAPPHISESLFITTSIDDHDEEKRIYLYAAINLKRNLVVRSTDCTVEATDIDKASRGLSTIAELLVWDSENKIAYILEADLNCPEVLGAYKNLQQDTQTRRITELIKNTI